MKQSLNLRRTFLAISITVALFVVLVFLMLSSKIQNEALSIGITVDLLLFVPVVYFFLIRKTAIPKTSVVPVVAIGLALGLTFLPKDQQHHLLLFKTWVLPVLELTLLSIVALKVRKAIKHYKQVRSSKPDFYNALKQTCKGIMPDKVANVFATEMAVIYYGIFNWRSRKPLSNEFTYHKNGTTTSLLIGILIIVGIEMFVLHAIVAEWSLIVAWILTGLSIYTGFQVLGILKSLSQRPIVIEDNCLYLKLGILSETKIVLSNIESIELSSADLVKNNSTRSLSPLGELDSHNVVITLYDTEVLIGLYGIKKTYKTLALHVDDPEEFKNQILTA